MDTSPENLPAPHADPDASAAPDAEAPAAPWVLQLSVALPEDVGDFGLVETISLPAALLEQDWDSMGDLIGQALHAQFARAATSIAASFAGVLEVRSLHGAPLTGAEYIAYQQAAVDAQAAARAAAEAATADLAGGSRG
jgi:hypothetical protein